MAADRFGRRVDYLRVSLTDRCNLRCVYCMPAEGVVCKAHDEILAFEEIERFAAIAVQEGLSRIRLTGGEPLVRQGVAEHVSRLRRITGLDAIALTTNGTLLARYARDLKTAGLTRVNISLDSLDPAVYARITRGGRLQDALAGIKEALKVGFDPIKLNVVVVPSLEQDLLGFAKLSIERPLHVRFIEYMPLGSSEDGSGCHSVSSADGPGWSKAGMVTSAEIVAQLSAQGAATGLGELVALGQGDAPAGWGPAAYFRFPGALGTIGVISPLSRHFCAMCNRLRLTADGRVRPCLFSDDELDVRAALRNGSDLDVRDIIRRALQVKPESHEERIGTIRGMSQIGG